MSNLQRPRIVVTRRLLPATEARMAVLFDCSFNPDDHRMTESELVEAMAGADVLIPTVTDRISTELISSAGPRLRLIANFGAGTEHIDLHAARERKIMVTNTPGVFTDDTADLTMALIVTVARRFSEGVKLLVNGQWQGWSPSQLLGHRIGGKRLGIIGLGRIGQAVAHRARAFGLEVSYHNRHRLPEALENMLGVRWEPELDSLVATADILSLHCPGSPETRNILSADRIASMKQGAYVVNTARGELIDEEALIAGLSDGRLGGAALDVFAHEPAIDRRLIDLPNVILMPHQGSATIEGREASGERVILNVRMWADGHRPPDQVLEGWA